MNLRKYINPIETYTRKNAPTILSTLSMIGVVTTAVLAVRDSKKAEDLICKRNQFKVDNYGEDLTLSEKVIAATPAYFPTILSGVSTITCIYGSNQINQNRQALLISAYGYLDNCYKEYRTATKELYGSEADDKIRDHIVQQKLPEIPTDYRDEEISVYEEYSDTYIVTTRNKLDVALHQVNKHFNVFGALSINDFLDFLDCDSVEHGDTYGWAINKNYECNNCMLMIDAVLQHVTSPAEYPLYRIEWNIAPSIDYIEWHLIK